MSLVPLEAVAPRRQSTILLLRDSAAGEIERLHEW